MKSSAEKKRVGRNEVIETNQTKTEKAIHPSTGHGFDIRSGRGVVKGENFAGPSCH